MQRQQLTLLVVKAYWLHLNFEIELTFPSNPLIKPVHPMGGGVSQWSEEDAKLFGIQQDRPYVFLELAA